MIGIVGYQFTNANKAVAVETLALAFEQGQITIPPDETLIAELETYTAERLPSGMVRYGVPEPGHDDCVVALMLAWLAVAQQGAYEAF